METVNYGSIRSLNLLDIPHAVRVVKALEILQNIGAAGEIISVLLFIKNGIAEKPTEKDGD